MKIDQVTIMLVEDDEVDVMNVKRVFSKHKVTNPLLVARDGREALDMLKGNNGMEKINPTPRIILLDINMPRMDGFEFLEAIRKDPELKSISVFVMTTSSNDEDRYRAYSLNVAGYIVKPVVFQEFMEAVANLGAFWKLCEFV